MATTPRDRLNREKENIKSAATDGTITTATRDRLLEFADALDGETIRYEYRNVDGEIKTYQPRSIEAYLSALRLCAESGLDLLDASAEDFNDLIIKFHDKEDKSKVTLARYQRAAEMFYRYHSDLRVELDEINKFKQRSESRHDETDMFSEEEIEALRRACGETQNPIRNRAFLELLVFTGQRIRALVTLRIKDVELNPPGSDRRGYIYLNDDYAEEHGGLKGATRRGLKRPLFGAKKYVRDWIEYHPRGDDPEAWLFIGDPNHWKTDPDDHWAKVSADHVLRRIGRYADVDKPVNPHNFRHYCATVLYRDYGVDRDTIRMLFGHVEDSRALEETYTHILDEDYIKKAEEALGYRDEQDNRNPFTPETCPTCGELLQDDWRQCPNCQEVFAPDDLTERLIATQEDATKEAVESMDEAEIEALKAIIEAIDDPEALAAQLAGEFS